MAFRLPALRMADGSLFAILLRSPWWASLLVALVLFGLMRLFLPAIFAVVFALPFLVVAAIRAWRQLQAPSPRRLQALVDSVRAMSWETFSRTLTEAWQGQGARVEPIRHSGADFLVTRDGRVTVVAARRWKAARSGIEVLEALQGSRERLDVHDALFIATGEITEQARAYAAKHLIRLGGPEMLLDLLEPRRAVKR
jgi:restriction system protein